MLWDPYFFMAHGICVMGSIFQMEDQGLFSYGRWVQMEDQGFLATVAEFKWRTKASE